VTGFKLENWKNFQKADVELQRRVFLIGPNASGKSNFIDGLRFLNDVVSVGGGLQSAVKERGGVSRLRCLAARRYSDLTVAVTIGTDEVPDEWHYELTFNQDSQRHPEIRRELVTKRGRVVIDRPDQDDRSDPERLSQTYLEQVNVNKEFREIADFLRTLRYLHIVPQLVRDPERSVGVFEDPFGGDFLEQIARTPLTTQRARLKRITAALKVAVPQLLELELSRDEGTAHLRGRYEHWRPQGAWQSENQFSDGTLRLIGLLWSVLDGSGPLLLEEPELSLHPEVVRFLPQLFARVQQRSQRQMIISTHSPELLADEGIGLDELLLLNPDAEGTEVQLAGSRHDIRGLMDSGIPLPQILVARTRPRDVEQMALFGSG